jgi:Flp pilus assembly protein CpaB
MYRRLLPKYVLLEVTEEQAVFLAYAKSNGRLELSGIPG